MSDAPAPAIANGLAMANEVTAKREWAAMTTRPRAVHIMTAALLCAGPSRAVSVHGGVGYSFPLFASVHLQVEWSWWFIGAEAGTGFGAWGEASDIQLLKAGFILNAGPHPYIAFGVGHGSTGENYGSGLALAAEAGLLLGHDGPWGRLVPYVEVPWARWKTTAGGVFAKPFSPGSFWLVGLKLLL